MSGTRGPVLLIVALTLLIAGANAAEPPVPKVIFDGLTTRPAVGPLGKGLGFLAGLALAREGRRAFPTGLRRGGYCASPVRRQHRGLIAEE